MTEEEKKIADEVARVAAEAGTGGEFELTPLEKAEEEVLKIKEERDNYKAVALKRLGKLPGDAEFLGDKDLSVADQVKLILLDREIDAKEKAEQEEKKKILKENSELKIALKNRPGGSIGGEGGSIVDVKDNIFNDVQLAELRRKAAILKADPEKFIEKAKQNFSKQR